MQIPSLPTDNLYKFCAMAGIALFIFGASYSLEKSLELKLRVASDGTQIEVMQAQLEFLKEDVSRQKQDVERVTRDLESLKRQKRITDEQLDSAKSENSATVAAQAKLVETSRRIRLQAVRLRGEVNKSRIVFHSFILMSLICGLSILVGPWLAWFGFRRWYALVQEPQDKLAQDKRGATSS